MKSTSLIALTSNCNYKPPFLPTKTTSNQRNSKTPCVKLKSSTTNRSNSRLPSLPSIHNHPSGDSLKSVDRNRPSNLSFASSLHHPRSNSINTSSPNHQSVKSRTKSEHHSSRKSEGHRHHKTTEQYSVTFAPDPVQPTGQYSVTFTPNLLPRRTRLTGAGTSPAPSKNRSTLLKSVSERTESLTSFGCASSTAFDAASDNSSTRLRKPTCGGDSQEGSPPASSVDQPPSAPRGREWAREQASSLFSRKLTKTAKLSQIFVSEIGRRSTMASRSGTTTQLQDDVVSIDDLASVDMHDDRRYTSRFFNRNQARISSILPGRRIATNVVWQDDPMVKFTGRRFDHALGFKTKGDKSNSLVVEPDLELLDQISRIRTNTTDAPTAAATMDNMTGGGWTKDPTTAHKDQYSNTLPVVDKTSVCVDPPSRRRQLSDRFKLDPLDSSSSSSASSSRSVSPTSSQFQIDIQASALPNRRMYFDPVVQIHADQTVWSSSRSKRAKQPKATAAASSSTGEQAKQPPYSTASSTVTSLNTSRFEFRRRSLSVDAIVKSSISSGTSSPSSSVSPKSHRSHGVKSTASSWIASLAELFSESRSSNYQSGRWLNTYTASTLSMPDLTTSYDGNRSVNTLMGLMSLADFSATTSYSSLWPTTRTASSSYKLGPVQSLKAGKGGSGNAPSSCDRSTQPSIFSSKLRPVLSTHLPTIKVKSSQYEETQPQAKRHQGKTLIETEREVMSWFDKLDQQLTANDLIDSGDGQQKQQTDTGTHLRRLRREGLEKRLSYMAGGQNHLKALLTRSCANQPKTDQLISAVIKHHVLKMPLDVPNAELIKQVYTKTILAYPSLFKLILRNRDIMPTDSRNMLENIMELTETSDNTIASIMSTKKQLATVVNAAKEVTASGFLPGGPARPSNDRSHSKIIRLPSTTIPNQSEKSNLIDHSSLKSGSTRSGQQQRRDSKSMRDDSSLTHVTEPSRRPNLSHLSSASSRGDLSGSGVSSSGDFLIESCESHSKETEADKSFYASLAQPSNSVLEEASLHVPDFAWHVRPLFEHTWAQLESLAERRLKEYRKKIAQGESLYTNQVDKMKTSPPSSNDSFTILQSAGDRSDGTGCREAVKFRRELNHTTYIAFARQVINSLHKLDRPLLELGQVLTPGDPLLSDLMVCMHMSNYFPDLVNLLVNNVDRWLGPVLAELNSNFVTLRQDICGVLAYFVTSPRLINRLQVVGRHLFIAALTMVIVEAMSTSCSGSYAYYHGLLAYMIHSVPCLSILDCVLTVVTRMKAANHKASMMPLRRPNLPPIGKRLTLGSRLTASSTARFSKAPPRSTTTTTTTITKQDRPVTTTNQDGCQMTKRDWPLFVYYAVKYWPTSTFDVPYRKRIVRVLEAGLLDSESRRFSRLALCLALNTFKLNSSMISIWPDGKDLSELTS